MTSPGVASLPRPSMRTPASRSRGAGPAPTAAIRSPSMTMWPSASSRRSSSTVAIAQPSMTVGPGTARTLPLGSGTSWTRSDAGRLDRDAFVARFGGVFEESPWIAAAAWERRPFATVAELHAAMVAVVAEAPRDDRLALIRAHPDLGHEGAHRRGVDARAGGRRPGPAHAASVRADHHAHRRARRALRLPVHRVRARAHAGHDHRRGGGARRRRARRRRSARRWPRSPRSRGCASTTCWRAHDPDLVRQARGARALRRRPAPARAPRDPGVARPGARLGPARRGGEHGGARPGLHAGLHGRRQPQRRRHRHDEERDPAPRARARRAGPGGLPRLARPAVPRRLRGDGDAPAARARAAVRAGAAGAASCSRSATASTASPSSSSTARGCSASAAGWRTCGCSRPPAPPSRGSPATT